MRPDIRAHGLGLIALLVPAAMQLFLFAFFARVLGVGQYGLYLALMSWSPICFELVGWGAGEYLLKRTAQDPTGFTPARRHMRAALLVSLPLATAAFAMLTLSVLGPRVHLAIILMIGFAEFAGLRLLVNAEQSALALNRMSLANWLRATQVLPRLMGVLIVFAVFQNPDSATLALGGSLGVLGAGLGISWLVSASQSPARGAVLLPEAMQQGTWFMGTQLVRAGQHNIDRVVLAPLVDPVTLGLYGAAQRFVQLGLLPLQSVLRLAYPGFFRSGSSGISPALRHALAVLPLALGASALTALALILATPFLPILIGPEFAQSANYLLYLAPILVLFTINALFSDALSGAGFLPLRLLLTLSGVVVHAAMFWAFHDGLEIVLASYAGMGLSCALTGTAALVLTIHERRVGKAQAASL